MVGLTHRIAHAQVVGELVLEIRLRHPVCGHARIGTQHERRAFGGAIHGESHGVRTGHCPRAEGAAPGAARSRLPRTGIAQIPDEAMRARSRLQARRAWRSPEPTILRITAVTVSGIATACHGLRRVRREAPDYL